MSMMITSDISTKHKAKASSLVMVNIADSKFINKFHQRTSSIWLTVSIAKHAVFIKADKDPQFS